MKDWLVDWFVLDWLLCWFISQLNVIFIGKLNRLILILVGKVMIRDNSIVSVVADGGWKILDDKIGLILSILYIKLPTFSDHCEQRVFCSI